MHFKLCQPQDPKWNIGTLAPNLTIGYYESTLAGSCVGTHLRKSHIKCYLFVILLFPSVSHRGQPPCDQRDPRERPSHLLWLHSGWDHLGCRQGADLHADPNSVLLLPVASNHPGRRLLHAKQAFLQQHGGHPGLRRHRDLLERRQFGAVTVGVSHGRSHG